MPEMIPVGNTVKPPDPMQGLNTLSSILGFQQQRTQLAQQQQTLQTGQAVQQQEQAKAQQQQQMMVERQKLQAFMQGGKDTDGSPLDPNSDDYGIKIANFARGNLPLIGNDVAQAATKTQNDKISLRGSVADLQQKYRTGLGGIVSGFVGSGASADKVNDAIDEYVRQNPDAMEAGHWAQSLIGHLDKAQDPGLKDHMLATVASTLSGTAQQEPGTLDTNAQIIPGAQSKFGLGFTPHGSAINKAPGPVGGPAYAGQTAAATSRATGGAGIDIDRATQVSKSIQPSQAAIPLTQEIDSLADQIHAGKFAAEISQAAAYAGITEETYARQLLVKDLGQVRSAAIRGAPSIEAADTILSGYPESTSAQQTIHTSMDLVRGTFRQNVDRGLQLMQMRQKDPSLTGFAQADDQLTNSRNPYMSEFRALAPEQRTEFYKRHFKSADEAQAFKKKALAQ